MLELPAEMLPKHPKQVNQNRSFLTPYTYPLQHSLEFSDD